MREAGKLERRCEMNGFVEQEVGGGGGSAAGGQIGELALLKVKGVQASHGHRRALVVREQQRAVRRVRRMAQGVAGEMHDGVIGHVRHDLCAGRGR
jgi:hypothetical protein